MPKELKKEASERRSCRRLERGEDKRLGPSATKRELVATEEPLEIRLSGEPFVTTMRTPGMDRELALGLLFSEGIIRGLVDVGQIAHCARTGDEGGENLVDVLPAPGSAFDADVLGKSRRKTLTSSACGVCGRQTIDDLLARIEPLAATVPANCELLARAPELLRARQTLFTETGGVHGAAALDRNGEVLAMAEDVGRHNAVDKVVGALLLSGCAGVDASERPTAILVVSGRVSFEIAQKAAAARIPAVVAVSAPTTLAIDLAKRVGITLAAFARDGSATVYTEPRT